MKKLFAIRLDSKIIERLDRLAVATNRTKSYYARLALELLLEKMEDVYMSQKQIGTVKDKDVQFIFVDGLPSATTKSKNKRAR